MCILVCSKGMGCACPAKQTSADLIIPFFCMVSASSGLCCGVPCCAVIAHTMPQHAPRTNCSPVLVYHYPCAQVSASSLSIAC